MKDPVSLSAMENEPPGLGPMRPSALEKSLARLRLSQSQAPYLCIQCRTMDFEAALDVVAREHQGGPGGMLLAERVGLDAKCALCQLLANVRNMLMHSSVEMMFRPIPIAVLHAGEGVRDYIKHMDEEEREDTGFLVFVRTKDLKDLLLGQYDLGSEDDQIEDYQDEESEWVDEEWDEDERSDEDDELSSCEEDDNESASEDEYEVGLMIQTRFINAKYDPSLARRWIDLCSGDSGDCSDDGDITDDGSNNGVHSRECEEAEGNADIDGMMVIDCMTLEVVSRTSVMRYVTLSYVWSLAHEDMVSLDAQELADFSSSGTQPSHSDNVAFDLSPHSAAVSSSNRKLPTVVPRVVHNAIQVTSDLGYRYLWVDQFCIDQAAPDEQKAEHISKMDLIYSMAEVTIIAASSSGALPGVGSTPRVQQTVLNLGIPDEKLDDLDSGITVFTTPPPLQQMISKQVWFGRGWCFQEELLSRRRLYFTDHQMMFQGEQLCCSETYPDPHTVTDNMFGDVFDDKPSLTWPESWDAMLEKTGHKCEFDHDDPRGRFWTEVYLVFQLLQVYTGKNLTYGEDSINGFLGALKVLEANDPHFKTIAGIPLFIHPEVVRDKRSARQTDFTRFHHRALAQALSWRHVFAAKRRPQFPSWSWAGWEGKIELNESSSERSSDITSYFNVFGVETCEGRMLDLTQVISSHLPSFLVGECFMVDRYEFLFYHEWINVAPNERLGLGVSWHARSLYPGSILGSQAESERHMARLIERGDWACLLLHYSLDEKGPKYVNLLVVKWHSEGHQHHHFGHSFRACSRVGYLNLFYGISDADMQQRVNPFDSSPRVRIRLG
ncbi:uncharacterized protein JN550_010920 [Neoarthrinium moseri]|uniref:uncharacterized protein n=1 Tax=Neoarthrinium moseri TaxID=1658444 RepID=UPI001FDB6F9A|nr:uncharacterized protein JN550_010920 [Neoarthrinium moseri]KAI1861390.1 hypothetical protein JN550_010920 [Neoarthrinium moseri]